MNGVPRANRVHIGFFGRRNTGKSSLVNAVTGQDLVIVSEIKGTTTDPVSKSMELLPLGPVVIIDTPGIDDEGPLGELRVRRAKQILNKTDVAVLVVDAVSVAINAAARADTSAGLTEADRELTGLFREKRIPYIIACNKSDLLDGPFPIRAADTAESLLPVSAKTGANISGLKERIAVMAKTEEPKLQIVADLIRPGNLVVLVIPIDKAAPKGRLILPQQQTIRDVLEADAAAVVVKEFELRETLESLGKKPALVITDSQVFAKVSADTPPDIPLTSFSILFARLKGFLAPAVRGVKALDAVSSGDRILICEGCTHHRQCDDIGTVKLPRWIRQHTGKNPEFVFQSGGDFPEDLSPYKLVIHCGACMLSEREMKYRRDCAADQNIPFTNYGITIAHIQGILRRSLQIFPHLLEEFA
ncbi:MAG: [FeFe] hydrogenase H-cluster maturation GTPase HydF [Spirochaetaceae bacterium]|jgi:[FeFe] hydrogenase H-cluster maturation GTPase HydF|nr:[FeFe] hydrogenase H-cluster maturation GTPase HydF [Spirochaetaceae bacterium]